MADYHEELLAAAKRLVDRRTGQKGKLPAARVRRSISTCYYALFHFVAQEVTARVVGTGNELRGRRRDLTRTLTHTGLRRTFIKITGDRIDASVSTFFRVGAVGVTIAPDFARQFARAFMDAQKKREDADYDLNSSFSERDARLLRLRARRVIRLWKAARSPADRDFKHALAVLILIGGQLRGG